MQQGIGDNQQRYNQPSFIGYWTIAGYCDWPWFTIVNQVGRFKQQGTINTESTVGHECFPRMRVPSKPARNGHTRRDAPQNGMCSHQRMMISAGFTGFNMASPRFQHGFTMVSPVSPWFHHGFSTENAGTSGCAAAGDGPRRVARFVATSVLPMSSSSKARQRQWQQMGQRPSRWMVVLMVI